MQFFRLVLNPFKSLGASILYSFLGPTSWLSANDNSTDDVPSPAAQLNENYFSLEDKLRMNLLQTYNKDTRPSPYHQEAVEVSIGLDLLHFELVSN